MITRWILIDDKTGKPDAEAYETSKDAWKRATELAREQNRSPYEWTSYAIEVPVK